MTCAVQTRVILKIILKQIRNCIDIMHILRHLKRYFFYLCIIYYIILHRQYDYSST